MKVVGVRLSGQEQTYAGRLEDNGDRVRLLTELEAFWSQASAWTNPETPHLRLDGRSFATADVDVVPPVLPSARIFCIGLNYGAHVAEGNHSHHGMPAHPTIFARWTQSLTTGGVPVPVPSTEEGLDWEGEVAAYVGKTLIDASPDSARASVLGFSTFNDLSARTAQNLSSQWVLGKNADSSGPLGPIVTTDETGDLRDGLQITTRVNGTVVQNGNTKDMVFELGDVLSLISHTLTIWPGDVLCTGTPEGVGYARTPKWLLQPGDVVEVEVDRLGALQNPIVSNEHRHGEPHRFSAC